MRLEFDRSVPRHEQLLRTADAKTPGRKHQKRKGVKAQQRVKNHEKNSAAVKSRESKKYHAKVAAYWRGETDEHPGA